MLEWFLTLLMTTHLILKITLPTRATAGLNSQMSQPGRVKAQKLPATQPGRCDLGSLAPGPNRSAALLKTPTERNVSLTGQSGAQQVLCGFSVTTESSKVEANHQAMLLGG